MFHTVIETQHEPQGRDVVMESQLLATVLPPTAAAGISLLCLVSLKWTEMVPPRRKSQREGVCSRLHAIAGA